MVDRSSRARTAARAGPRPGPSGGSCKLRSLRRWGRPGSRYLLGLHASTVHKVLTRYRMARLA